MNNKQEGFDDNDTCLYHFISEEVFSRAVNIGKPQKIRNKYKMTFKVPLTLFNNVTLTQSPDQSIQLQWNQENSISPASVDSNAQCTKIDFDPLQLILTSQEKLIKTLGPEQNRIEKVSDIFPKKFICVYNRFHQNIFLKNDLTIIIKNVARCLKLELLKPIESPLICLLNKSSFKMFNSDKSSQDVENLKIIEKRPEKKSKRYQSQESLKSKDSKASMKKIQFSQFELQKSLIMNTELKKKQSDIQFVSNFESGNLHLAFKDKFMDNLFYLFLSNDINTHGFNQWFYFGIKFSGKQTKRYRFIIMNISKEFKYDQRMSLLSLYDGKWQHNTPFMVYRNKYSRYSGGNLTSLDFQYEFSSKLKQPVFFSLSYPYTFTRVVKFVKQVKSKDYKNLLVTIETLGKTELTNFIPVIRIQRTHQSKKLKETLKQKSILFLARQHASETPSSFICQSLVRNLLSQNKDWQSLLKTYKFVIIPMANPDGVIHGNSRTNIKGYDINRLWQPSRGNFSFMSIETEEMNNYLMDFIEKESIEYTIDLHSHSRDYGSFVYCCDNSENSRLFRYYFTKNHPQCCYQKCKINLTSDKKCTFRGQMYHRLGIKNSYTIQTSYYGYLEQKENETPRLVPFKLHNFQNIAQSILFSLNEILKIQSISEEHKEIIKVIDQIDNNYKALRRTNLLKTKQYNNESDSDPQNEYLEIKERRQIGQTINERHDTSKSLNKLHGVHSKNDKSQGLVLHNKSLQMVSKMDHYQPGDSQPKKKRKRIYTSLGSGNRTKVEQSPKETGQHSMSKKFQTQAEKLIDFRNTLRRGFNMSQSETGFYRFRQTSMKKIKQPEKKQSANCIVYPTSTDLQISSQNIRLLHENLFKGRIKVKSIKEQQHRFLKRMGKGELMGQQSKSTNTKGSYQNKIAKDKSKQKEKQNSKQKLKQMGELLSIEKIQQLRLSSCFNIKN